MERDNMIAQGASYFLNDRLFENSDKYQVYVCKTCGYLAVNKYIKSTNKVEPYCKSCEKSEIALIYLPYSSKLLFQELQCMNILPRIITS